MGYFGSSNLEKACAFVIFRMSILHFEVSFSQKSETLSESKTRLHFDRLFVYISCMSFPFEGGPATSPQFSITAVFVFS